MKKVVIAGASSGIGKAVAKLFIAAGWKVYLSARRVELLEELRMLNPENVKCYKLDISEQNSESLLEQMLLDSQNADIYFHVAGRGNHNINLDTYEELNTVKTNCEGFVRHITKAFNVMASCGGGQIAAVTSIAGTKGLGAAPIYSASKRMQSTYIQALAQLSKMRDAHIRFTEIRPGFVKTDLLDNQRNYPLLLSVDYAAEVIFKAIVRCKRIKIVDWKYSILVFFWKLIPDFIWERFVIDAAKKS